MVRIHPGDRLRAVGTEFGFDARYIGEEQEHVSIEFAGQQFGRQVLVDDRFDPALSTVCTSADRYPSTACEDDDRAVPKQHADDGHLEDGPTVAEKRRKSALGDLIAGVKGETAVCMHRAVIVVLIIVPPSVTF